MRPIENIFGFDCVTCEHNRNCYSGNMGNQFRHCQKSAEKIQNLDTLEKENKQLKEKYINAVSDYETTMSENKQLKEKLDKYENPEDMTLFTMWCTEKVKDENKQLKANWNKLREWLKEYEEGSYGLGAYETGISDGLGDVIKKMRELEGSDSDE